MALKVALRLLSFLLLLAINGLPSQARDLMKLQQDQVDDKQVNQPYLDGWLKDTQAEKEKPGHNSNAAYLDGWLKDTHDGKQNPGHNANSVYLDGWLKNAHDDGKQKPSSNQVYLDGWLKNNQDGNQKSTHNSNQVYLDGWLKNTPQGNEKTTHDQAYLDGWLKDNKDVRGKISQKSNQAYLDGWLKDTTGDNKEKTTHNQYLDGWLKDGKEKTNNQVYLDGWLKDSQKSNQVYLDGWLKDSHQSKQSNQVYLDGWLKDSHQSKQSNQVYLDGWLKDSQQSNQVYLDGWLKDNKKTSQEIIEGKQSSKVDHTEAFKLAFFTLDDLYVGNVMTLEFPIREYAPFLPRKQADAIPFSKAQAPSLLQLFKLTEGSPQGEDMKDIIDQCEYAPTKGETKACPTSVDSMVEFVQSVLGAETKYNIHSTSYPTTSGARMQNYTVLGISEDIYAPKWVACHPRPYPYALYYCHYLDIGSKVFKVLLGGEYGDLMDALGICHLDTSDMNPNHILFKYLGMKPGEAPLCHFFPVKHLLWVPLAPDATM